MQTTLDSKKGYYDGIECCFDDYAEPNLLDELEEKVGQSLNEPIIIESVVDDEESPCPKECPVIQGIADPDDECPHCNLESLTMGETQPYLRKRYL